MSNLRNAHVALSILGVSGHFILGLSCVQLHWMAEMILKSDDLRNDEMKMHLADGLHFTVMKW